MPQKADRAGLEFKRCPVTEVKILDDEQRIIRGWISTEHLDYQDDIMEAEGCDESEFDGMVLAGHRVEPEYVVGGGKILQKVAGKGVEAEWQLAKGEPGVPLIADQLWSLIKQGFLKKLSIGFKAVESVMEQTERRWIRRVKKWKLFEFSHVALAANRMAEIETVKALLSHLIGGPADDALAAEILTKKSGPYDAEQATVLMFNEANQLKLWLLDELKAGRVLSGANERRLRTALGVMVEILEQLGESEEEAETEDGKAAHPLVIMARDPAAWKDFVTDFAAAYRAAS